MTIRGFILLLNVVYCKRYCNIQKKELPLDILKGGWDYKHGLEIIRNKKLNESCTEVDCGKGKH